MARKRRSFTSELKVQAVLDVLTGSLSAAEVCRRHKIKPQLFAIWKATLLERLSKIFNSTTIPATIPIASPNSSNSSAAKPMNSRS